MKFLIDNFSSHDTTQPLYLNKYINTLGHESHMRIDPNQSLYDVMDTISPDFYITAISTLSQDAVLYLKENIDKNISIIICTNGARQNIVEEAENLIVTNEINCSFFYGNNPNIKTKKLRYVLIPEAADLNINPGTTMNYSIDKAVIVTEKSMIRNYQGTYHVISLLEKMNKCDFYAPVGMLTAIYKMYNEIILTTFDGYISQVFFDGVARGAKVYYDIHDKQEEKLADEIFSKVFKIDTKLNYNNPDKLLDFTELKKYILEKHSGINRAKTFLSQLPQQVFSGENQ